MQLTPSDFGAHNEEVRRCWDAYRSGKPYRVPVVVGTNTRYFILNPDTNPERLTFERYSEDPDAMFRAQLEFSHWSRHYLLQDAEMGIPERWWVCPDFQNYYEAAWFGCPVRYLEGQVPDTLPIFAEEPERVMDAGPPDPFGGLFARGLEFGERMCGLAKKGFCDRPIDVGLPGGGTDGPMTVACNLFSPEVVCTMMAEEPKRLHALFDFITAATIDRMSAWRDKAGVQSPQDGFWIADDSIALISTPMYREHVLPYHRRLFEAFASGKGRGIHLCGDATRHFRTIVDELGVEAFDTGFPVDFAVLRQEVGPKVAIQGGPHAELMRSGTAAQVFEESRRILESGVLAGPFILREGNNLAPGTPPGNVAAMYAAGRRYGNFPPQGASA